MKEATGELNMTVVTLIAVAALGAVFYFAVWPLVQNLLIDRTCKTYGSDYKAVRGGEADDSTNTTQAKTYKWYCCTGDVETPSVAAGCFGVDDD